ncbi:hypothetical protein AYO21_04682 [Fonsecaea monophora]|uniref:DUF726-domain-containing protein n=1 Tax=Fonsecaea monophora TaxID=254056 RepID=A0A177FCZ5_9EURO|nr:hypothetical protein AYO21_04682 [Fonsecaea monophora]KAH0839087.1 putative membrane protein [Fonsecaea pedrosoi]OAG41069.1 hypothetical protein AYO21_04682 [Fonsecaea monophora]
MPSLSSLKNRVNAAIPQQRPGGFSRPHSGGDHQRKAEDDQSLGTLLTREERADLTLLISQTIEEMRRSLVRTFDERPKPKPKADPTGAGEAEPDKAAAEVSKLSLSAQQSEEVDEQSREASLESPENRVDEDEPRGVGAEPQDTLLTTPTPESKALKSAALAFFDNWAESVILRVGEVVNSRDEAVQNKNLEQARRLATEAAQQQYQPSNLELEANSKLLKVFPPVQTPLANLSQGERSTIIKAILLLLLSLEAYRAHSRVLLVRLAMSLGVNVGEVSKMEKDTAYGLLTAAAKMDASESTQKAQQASSTARKWKIGVAGVAGAALIGITGGLAAPLLAAGVGTLMGGLGLGATAAAGYLGALAGSSVLVGGLFGAYGARMTSQAMDKYSKEIDDFAFLPINGREDDAEEVQKQRRRLRITVGISGWLTEEEQVTLPWRVLGEGGEPFALRWELQALLNLGSALKDFVVSQAWSQIRRELIKRTIFAAVWSAVMAPLAIRKAIRLVDSPFGIAKMRAVKAGEVLADALINRVQGERPVSLIGQSLGARVVYSCLLTLAKRGAFGLVDHVVLMGAPVPADAAQWRAMRSVVAGRLVNVYSRQDYILAFLYRTSSAQISVAGLQDIEGVVGVENFDLSARVDGHLKYLHMTGPILREIGWVDLDEDVLRREEMLVDQIDRDERAVEDQGDDPEKLGV